MIFNRTKNATRNILFSLCQRIYSLILQFLLRTIFIYTLGTQYLGLNELFSSVLHVLNLTELGVGSAMVYSMYKPLAEDDTETICALMRLYKIYYRIIGFVVLALGISFIPFLPLFFKEELPADINIYALYLLNLASTVITYWLFAYKNSILVAAQRADVNVKISLGIGTLTILAQIFVLRFAGNYYLYIAVSIVTCVISNLVTAVVSSRMFPQFKAKGRLPKESIKEINHRVRDLFTGKIGTVVINSIDTIVISSFLGLTVLAKYQSYLLIMNAIIACIGIIYKSIIAIIGNSLITESVQKNYKIFRVFLFIIAWISAWCSSCLLCLYQPFVQLWVGKDLMLDFGIVVCFCIYFFTLEINRVLNLYKDAYGMWRSDRARPLIISVINLSLNLLTVTKFGLYGILLSTVVPFIFLSYPWLTNNLCRGFFSPRYFKEILVKIAFYFFAAAIAAASTYFACSLLVLSPVLTIIVRALICLIIPNVILFIAFVKTSDFKDTLKIIDESFIKGRSRILKRLTDQL